MSPILADPQEDSTVASFTRYPACVRPIRPAAVAVFAALFLPGLAAAGALGAWLLRAAPLGAYRPLAVTAFAAVLSVVVEVLLLRLFLRRHPFGPGECRAGSPEDFHYQVYVLFYLMFFQFLCAVPIIPIPLMRWVYVGLGARLGRNTYSAGTLLDPHFIRVGDNTILGFESVLCAHAVEGGRVSFAPIVIGDNVTVGLRAVLLPGVVVGDGAIIAAGAVVVKNTRIGAGEIWGGIPARFLRRR
jgi:acetyltransferase-like isoleucine patch superfamily enzyme